MVNQSTRANSPSSPRSTYFRRPRVGDRVLPQSLSASISPISLMCLGPGLTILCACVGLRMHARPDHQHKPRASAGGQALGADDKITDIGGFPSQIQRDNALEVFSRGYSEPL